MKILSVYFNRIARAKFKTLLTVFKASAARHMPDVPIEIIAAEVPPVPKHSTHQFDTATAFFLAAHYALESEEPLVICDIDVMFRGDVTAGLERVTDIGITTRDGFKHPYNTGIWFFQPTEKAREFVHWWIFWTREMVKKFDEKRAFIMSHGGIDQASLALTIEDDRRNVQWTNIARFPCSIWNAEQSTWAEMTDETKVVHIKSGLRQACWGKGQSPKLVAQWPDTIARQKIITEFRNYL